MNIGIIIGRIGGVDGVALETEKWIDVLKAMGDRLIIMQDGKIVNDLNKEDENFLEKAKQFELSDLTGVEDEI